MITAFIFARGGSKGLPGKNIKPLMGKPLLQHAIECAAATKHVNKVIVATDDYDIAAVAMTTGSDILMLPSELTQDDSPEWLAWRWAVKQLGTDMFVSVPCTAPFRLPSDIDACIELLGRNPKEAYYDVVLMATEARPNPYHVSVTLQDALIRPIFWDKLPANRQNCPSVLTITGGCYATWPKHIKSAKGLLDGRIGAIIVPQERAIDIDTQFDFDVAEALAMKDVFNLAVKSEVVEAA